MSENTVPRISANVPAFISALISMSSIRAFLIFLLCVSSALIVLTAFLLPFNGDEAIFLSNIHRAANGWQLGLLQTAHVHLFGWLPSVGDEITQIKVGRVIYVGLWAISLTLLHRLARRLLDPLGALVGVVLFAVFLFSVSSATSFQIDGMLLPVLLSVALLLLNPTVVRVAAAGVLSGIGLALTVKAVLWAPAFLGVLAVGLWDRQDRLRPILAGMIAGAATFAGILMAHRWAISTESDPGPGVSVDGLVGLGTYMFFNGIAPQPEVLRGALILNPVTWTLVVIGFGLALAGLRTPETRRRSLILLFLASPVFWIVFYTNAFPYAYLVLIPTACLLAGKAFSRFVGTAEGVSGVTALLALAAAAIPMALFAVWELRQDHTRPQREILSVVHRLFEEPVHYIDVSGMVASFPREMPVITRAVLTPYRRAGVPVVTNYIHGSHPPLLIANSPSLDVWSEDVFQSVNPDLRLLPQDEETIRATYAQYWNLIYLAGRQWRDLGPDETRSFEIIVPGEHTLLASSPVTVDGETFAPGATIELNAGPHELRTRAAEPDLRILWGKDLKLPAEE